MKKHIEINEKTTLYNGKSEEVIPTLDDNSIDLVITSPPYNVDLGNNKHNKNPYDLYNDNLEHSKYIKWLRDDIFGPIIPKLKSGARVCINIGDPKNGRVPTHSDIIQFMTQELGLLPMTSIIWRKHQVGSRTAWGSYASPSCPSFPTPFEHIMVFSKDNVKLQEAGETDITAEEFKKWAFAEWDILPETRMKKIGHPAMMPLGIPRRLIKMLSWTNATVLDPFNGAGTTGVACNELGRGYIGIELSKAYCDITKDRIDSLRPATELDMFST